MICPLNFSAFCVIRIQTRRPCTVGIPACGLSVSNARIASDDVHSSSNPRLSPVEHNNTASTVFDRIVASLPISPVSIHIIYAYDWLKWLF